MKYLICSDIHGSESAARKILSFFQSMECDRLINLGDTLYHGPRNPLPEGHNPKGAADALNGIAGKIFSCRGNCDAEVDQMVLDFPTTGDYVQIVDGGITLFCTHGHVYAPFVGGTAVVPGAAKPLVEVPAVIFYGHTHVSTLEKTGDGIIVCNPGSSALPKGGTEAGFAVYENGEVTLFSMSGKKIKSLRF